MPALPAVFTERDVAFETTLRGQMLPLHLQDVWAVQNLILSLRRAVGAPCTLLSLHLRVRQPLECPRRLWQM